MMILEKEFQPHLDDCDLIAEKPWEGGDTACEHFASLVILNWMGIKTFFNHAGIYVSYLDATQKLLNLKSGLWRRHCAKNPTATKGLQNYWASEWNRGTRDNGTSLFIATIEFGDKIGFEAMYAGFVRRKWFCGNTFKRNMYARNEDQKKFGASWTEFDPSPTPPDYGGMLKAIAHRSEWTRKNTWFWDIVCCLIPAYLIKRSIKKGTNDGNNLNAWLRINFCVKRYPTWISKLALKILPKDIGLEKEFGDGSKMSKANPPMHLLVEAHDGVIKI